MRIVGICISTSAKFQDIEIALPPILDDFLEEGGTARMNAKKAAAETREANNAVEGSP